MSWVSWMFIPIFSSGLVLCLHSASVTNFNALDSHCVFVIPRASQWNMRAAIVDGVYLAWLGSRMWHSPLTTAAGKLRSLHFQIETYAARTLESCCWRMREKAALKIKHTCQDTPLFCRILQRISHNLKCTFPFLCWNEPIHIFLFER